MRLRDYLLAAALLVQGCGNSHVDTFLYDKRQSEISPPLTYALTRERMEKVYHGRMVELDIEGDGDLDIICGTPGWEGVVAELYLNKDGRFSKVKDWTFKSAQGSGGITVSVADVTDDGLQDVVLGLWAQDSFAPFRKLYLRNEGDGYFTSYVCADFEGPCQDNELK